MKKEEGKVIYVELKEHQTARRRGKMMTRGNEEKERRLERRKGGKEGGQIERGIKRRKRRKEDKGKGRKKGNE